MAIGAQHARAISVIQKDKVTDDFVLVGSHVLAKDTQILAAISFSNVAEHLVVSPVLLDDINHMLDERRLAHSFRHGPRCHTWPRWCKRGLFDCRAVIIENNAGLTSKFLGRRLRQQGQSAV